jgi:hypothetical protein
MSATNTIAFAKNVLDAFGLYNVLIFALIFVAVILILKNL